MKRIRLLVAVLVLAIPAVAWAYDKLAMPEPCPSTPDCPCNHGAS